jgi:eukaryotic-like serine/threonine-protein kinase
MAMRCEVCGAPVPSGADRCDRCLEARQSAPPVARTADGRPLTPQPLTARRITGRNQAIPLPSNRRDSSLPASVVLDGKYRLKDELGRGSMGTVFLAVDEMLRRKVAVKFLLPELADSEECMVRFQHEAVAMAAIRNENVAQIFSFGKDNGVPYFVMEYLEGETLESLVDSHNRRGFYIPLDDAVDLMIQALNGLAAIHRAGAIHRDIKPANVMLTSDPMRAVIMDFGLVRDVKLDDDVRSLAGTPAYIAPELVEGAAGADKSKLTDIYSIGTTFYEVLTGTIPFGGNSWVEILQKHIAELPVPPSVRRPGLPDALDEIVLRAMSKDPRERYQDAEAFIDDLVEVQSTPLPHERRPSLPPQKVDGATGSRRNSSPSGRYQTGKHRAFRSTPTGSRGKLLVADADADFRALVHGAAKSAVPGCRVHSATDGTMALDVLRTVKPHVVVLDLNLPEINGLELIATMRGDPDISRTEVIVATGSAGRREASLLHSLGVRHFLAKPVDGEELAVLLRPYLERPTSIPSPPPTR